METRGRPEGSGKSAHLANLEMGSPGNHGIQILQPCGSRRPVQISRKLKTKVNQVLQTK